MATDMGNFQKRKNVIWPIFFQRCIKRGFTGIHDRFLRDHVLRKRMLEHDRNEDVCFDWDDHLPKVRIRMLSLQAKIGGSLSISPEAMQNQWEKRSDFNQAFSTLKPLTPRSWRTNNSGPYPTGNTRNGDRHRVLPAMARILVVFLRIQRKVKKEVASKGLRSKSATRCWQNFGSYLRQMAFKNLFYFVTDRSFTADGGLVIDGVCKDNTSKYPFSRCELCKNLGYRLSRRWLGHRRTTTSRRKELLHLVLRMRGEMQLTYKTIPLNDATSDTNDNVKTKIQNTKHMKPNNDLDTLG